MTDVLTVEQFQLALPEKVKKSVNQALIDQVNKTLSEPELYEAYRNNLISYAKVMQDGRFKVDEYVNAVKYVSHKIMGCTNIEAYSKTFPDRIARHTANGVSAKDIASYVTAYNKSKLVNLIFEQSIIPTWVLNQDLFQSPGRGRQLPAHAPEAAGGQEGRAGHRGEGRLLHRRIAPGHAGFG
jgi:hypothetical protein